MSDAIKRIVDDLAPELDKRIEAWLHSDMIQDSREHLRLTNLLWDNKIGILRVLQACANGQSGDTK